MIRMGLAATLVAAMAVSGGSAFSQSSGLSWSYIEGGLSVIDVGFTDEAGFNIRGSGALGDAFYLHGSYDRWEVDTFFGDEDLDLYRFGVGFHTPLSDRSDLYVEGSYAGVGFFGANDDGFRVDFGLRGAANDRLEGRIYAGAQTDNGSSYEAILGADLVVGLTKQLGLVLAAETYEFDAEVYRVNLRLSF